MWTWSEDRIAFFFPGLIKGMRKHGEFKISLSKPKDRKILNSTTSGRVNGCGKERERDVLNVEAW